MSVNHLKGLLKASNLPHYYIQCTHVTILYTCLVTFFPELLEWVVEAVFILVEKKKKAVCRVNIYTLGPWNMLTHLSLSIILIFNSIADDASFRQEDLLAELGPKYGFDYVVVRPMTIIGAVKGNFLNLA
jgi:hypothetical protein